MIMLSILIYHFVHLFQKGRYFKNKTWTLLCKKKNENSIYNLI